ncbi:MAG: efflux RND transporter periplasmic adaptor subunit [Succinivibrionaceae bacterium]|nr:efflux RND transporter periplasmic adaptor subunit [Succinivibrionaceae bacterium]
MIPKRFQLPAAPAAGLLAAALLLATGCEQEQARQGGMAMPVDVFEVTQQSVPVVSHLTGRANSTRKAEVRPQVSGVVLKRSFTEGSTVQQGEQLYQIDPALYEAEVESARASLNSAKASMHSTSLKAERYRALLNNKAVSKQEFDDAQASFLQSKASVEAAQAALKRANINLAYTKVYAPISGKIARSSVTEGALVSAQQTMALTTITQLDPMYVDLGQSVEDNLLLKDSIKSGQLKLSADGKATVDLYLPNGRKYPFQGVIEFSEVSVDESTGMVNVRAVVPNPEHVLLPGMFLRGDINEGVRPDALVVLQTGVIREAGGITSAYIVNDQGQAQKVDIKLGPTFQDCYVVESGLKKGDKVIISNLQKIRTGVPVQVVPPQGAPAPAAPAAPGKEG